jgi:hypothetical protein
VGEVNSPRVCCVAHHQAEGYVPAAVVRHIGDAGTFARAALAEVCHRRMLWQVFRHGQPFPNGTGNGVDHHLASLNAAVCQVDFFAHRLVVLVVAAHCVCD